MNLVAIALFIIMAVILVKFRLVCEVTANGEKLGYIIDKEKFEQSINDMMTNDYNKIETQVEYHLAFINKDEETNDEEVLAKVEENIEKVNTVTDGVTIKVASAKLADSKTTSTTSSKKVTSRGTSTTKKSTCSVTKSNTIKSSETSSSTVKTSKTSSSKTSSSTAKASKTSSSSSKTTSLNGVKLTVKPVSGTITSRFGSRGGRQHTGLDIGAPKGTKIKAAAGGTVIFAGYSGAYGNVVKISHGSGIKTYYAHCSKLYVEKGQKVSAGDVIAAVGSTGRSTGNHLHFEIVKNGTSVNPQNYLYK